MKKTLKKFHLGPKHVASVPVGMNFGRSPEKERNPQWNLNITAQQFSFRVSHFSNLF